MSMFVTSPTYPFDEEEPMNVFESTAAEFGAPSRPRMLPVPDFSIICAGKESKTLSKPEPTKQGSGDAGGAGEKVKVFLRIRPLTDREKERGGEERCVSIQDNETLLLKAPKDSQNMKNAERGIVQSIHRFSFSKIFAPETSQQELYEATMKSMVRDVLQGQNRLLYTYGVTNSGKTYTIQGSGREAGLLPRALVSVFRKVQGRLYGAVDLKPAMHQDVRQLNSDEVRAEESRRDALLKEEVSQSSRHGGTSTWDSGVAGMSTFTSHIATQLEECDSVCLDSDSLTQSGGGSDLEAGVQFSIWVAFYEIYNEFLYDLLEAPPAKKRATLRLSEDKQGNPYVKDLTWVQVRSAEEAWKVLKAGRHNQSFASTHLNSNSSRSHSIFSLRVLHVHPEAEQGQATRISELSVVDLAGSERCKDQRSGERMKEASNINTSLHTLGRCIAALRHNQNNRSRAPQLVPFRDSKLTRVLQGFFCGRGTSCMVVNINPCSSIYDETLQALKFSAIATQLVHGPSTKSRVAYILSLLNEPASTLNASGLEEEDEEEEEESADEEEEDVTMLNTRMLLEAIDVLKREVWRQRAEKDLLEARVREEVVDEMMEHINTLQNQFSERLELERDMLEERYEARIENLKKNLKEYYSQQLEARDEEIQDLTDMLEKKRELDRRAEETNTAEDREASVLMPPPMEPPLAAPQVQPVLRRSQRSVARNNNTTVEVASLQAELTQCRAELTFKTQEMRKLEVQLTVPGPTGTLTNTTDRKLKTCQRNLRQLRVDLQRMGTTLQSSERACCRNTGGERLRRNLTAADETLAKQDQILVELQNSLQLVKADLRRQADSLAHMQASSSSDHLAAGGRSCKKRVCGANVENQAPVAEKKPFLHGLLPQSLRTPTRKCNPMHAHHTADDGTNHTPSSRILRSRQQSPMVNSPAFTTPRGRKY